MLACQKLRVCDASRTVQGSSDDNAALRRSEVTAWDQNSLKFQTSNYNQSTQMTWPMARFEQLNARLILIPLCKWKDVRGIDGRVHLHEFGQCQTEFCCNGIAIVSADNGVCLQAVTRINAAR